MVRKTVKLQSARMDNLTAVRDMLEDICQQQQVPESTCFNLVLCADEVCTNVIMHGYADQSPGPMIITAQADTDTITITVSDEGRPFVPEEVPTPDLNADWQTRKIGGLGLFLVKTLMDEIRYETSHVKGNRFTLIKYL